jgi:hypothetical protein
MLRFADVVRVLGEAKDPGLRTEVLSAFRALGGLADRWKSQDREAMARALVRAEDARDLRRWEHEPLRRVRRALEDELDAGANRRAA